MDKSPKNERAVYSGRTRLIADRLIMAIILRPDFLKILFPENMKGVFFSSQNIPFEHGVRKSLITKHHTRDNEKQRDITSLMSEPSISDDTWGQSLRD